MGMNSFGPFPIRAGYGKFVVKNLTTNKQISIFQNPIPPGRERDLLAIEGIGEGEIRISLLKGEILYKLLAKEITIVESDVDLLQFNTNQRKFLLQSGITSGLVITSAQEDVTYFINVLLDGVVDGINTVFTLPDEAKFLQVLNQYELILYYNGVRQLLTVDYTTSESGGVGTGFDTITFTDAPILGVTTSYITADYYVGNF